MEQKTLARWLKGVLFGVGLCAALVYFWILPAYGASLVESNPEFSGRFWPWLVFLWATAIPVAIILVLGWRVAGNIGKDRSFSPENARHLRGIASCAIFDGLFFFAGNAVLLLTDNSHPGIALFSLLIVFACFALGVAAAALSHLVRKAAVLQEQSDLTI